MSMPDNKINEMTKSYLFFAHNSKCFGDDKESEYCVKLAQKIKDDMLSAGYKWSERRNKFIVNR